jgi:hypothetical protein
MAFWLGWIAVMSIVVSASVPVGVRWRAGRRAAPDSGPIRFHVLLGTATTLVAFGHTLAALANLGSSGAIGGGNIALMTGAVAFMMLIAHAGIGLQLRNVRLKDRVAKRKRHVLTALTIAAIVTAHVVLLRTGAVE